MVASTVPSTTRVSQSVISTPLSLMLGPTVSLLPLLSLDAEEVLERGLVEDMLVPDVLDVLP